MFQHGIRWDTLVNPKGKRNDLLVGKFRADNHWYGDFWHTCHSSATDQAARIKGSSRIGLCSSDWLVDPNLIWLTPAALLTPPAGWIRPSGVLIDLGTLLANGDGQSAVSLNGCYELDAAVVMLVVVAVDKRVN